MKKNYSKKLLVTMFSFGVATSWSQCTDDLVTTSSDLDGILCQGEELTLSATSENEGTVSWDGDVVDGEAFVPPVGTTTYTVSSDNADDCPVSIEITVNALPEVEAASDAEDNTICAGEEVVLTGAGATSYAWNMDVEDDVAFSPEATTTYTVTGTDENGCENTAEIEVIVNALPEVEATSDAADDAICIGEDVVLTGAGAETYVWDMEVIDGETFSPEATATYTVTGTDANGCENTAEIEIVVNELPEVTASVSAEEICLGESAIFNGAGAESYDWDNDVIDGEAYTPAAEGTVTYTVTGTDENGCENTASVDLIVNDNALPEVTASVDNDEICIGEMITFTVDGATSYEWNFDVNEDGEATPAESGELVYMVTGTADNGCTNTAEVAITVNALPEVEIISDADEDAICIGEEVTLSGSGAVDYVWDGEVVDGEAFSPELTATYSVTGTDANGCEATDEIEITVNALPVVEAIVDEEEICLGESIAFLVDGAEEYDWNFDVAEDGTATPTESGELTYTVTGTDENGCENTDDVIVTVNALPEVEAISSDEDNAICIGEEVTLNGEGAESYTWDMDVTDGEAFAPEVGTVTYTVTGVDENLCENTAEIEITVNDLPEVTASVSAEEICLGESAVFTGGGADSYEWDMDVTDGEAFTPEAEGTVTYTVTGTDVNGCINTATVDLIVNNNPLPEVTASVTAEEICLEDEVTFTGGGAATYEWDNGVVDGEVFTPEAVGTVTYTVVGTADNGCTNSATIDVLVNALPVVEATVSDEDICIGDNVTFNGTGDEGVDYEWTEGVTDGEAFTPAAAGEVVYEVTGTDENGCVSEDEIAVMVNELPEVVATVDAEEICLGDEVVFEGEGATDYEWTEGVEDGVAFEPEALGTVTYEVTGTDENGCVNTDEIDVTVNAIPAVSGTADVSEVCLGESYTLTGDSEFDFSWGGDIEDGEPVTQEEAGDFTHIVTAVSPEGCIGTDMVSVTVHELPTVEAGLDQTHCTDTEIELSGSGAETYEWDGGITDGEMFTVEEGETTYTVTGTDENGCVDTDEIVITGITGPTVTGVVTNESASFNGAIDITVTGGVGPFGFSWDHGPTTEDVEGLSGGTYTVTIDDTGIEDGLCPVVEETFVVITTIGVEEVANKNVKVYPTPATENVTIEFAGEFNYELTAINGEVIYSGLAVDQENVSLYDLPAGIYLVKIVANGETITTKIAKQ